MLVVEYKLFLSEIYVVATGNDELVCTNVILVFEKLHLYKKCNSELNQGSKDSANVLLLDNQEKSVHSYHETHY